MVDGLGGDAIQRICEAFEAAFREGKRPAIEQILVEHSDLGSALLHRLLICELALRRERGDMPVEAEYRQRFPTEVSLISQLFAAETQPLSTQDQAMTALGDPGVIHSERSLETHPAHPSDPSDSDTPSQIPPPLPDQLGRYLIQRMLGKGGFGVVYLAHDPQLDRSVAIKVPRQDRFKSPQQVACFLQEARTAANLRHPGLVTVYDVQQENGVPYIVQEYINGENLGIWMTKVQPTCVQIASVLVGICEALSYAHQQRLTHCDLKLANVLMDQTGRPFVADFGLAVHDSGRAARRGTRFGTPPVMAPEQVRGEGHRLDGRTDIWAIGVMMYELLVKEKPFSAETDSDLFHEIEMIDPRPPRQLDRRIPRELERICLKCLQKRRVARYHTVDDLRDDLIAWLAVSDVAEGSTKSSISGGMATLQLDSESTSKNLLSIIPKGLRCFDAEDADFFLGLLPGPRDREGLPDSVRFWKNRIEERDPDDTFSIGLIYGPSGCGKTSLVRAGLLPRLDVAVVPIYVEATADNTEDRIRRQLAKHTPWLSQELSLPEMFAELRTIGAGEQRKLLIVIDQFEQWLHATPELKRAPLVDALRHCEGGMLQVVLMVRDDFFASVHRLFQELETPLLEGTNYALIDRFDSQHSRHVLTAFGRAFGRFDGRLNHPEQQFINRAVEELSESGKVVCVRLALFADMMKARPWTLASLREIGGVSGVGVTFLEETFSSKSSPPSHRVNELAIRQVLTALLPEAGLDIKGCMRSEEELRDAANFQNEPQRLAEVIRILDHELRIITPTEPHDQSVVATIQTKGPPVPSSSRHYQLTHDYLVPSLRQWLNRRKRETLRGRTEVTLADRAAAWNAKRENRQLPTILETLKILTLTDRRRWNSSESAMMRQAWRMLTIRSSIFMLALASVVALAIIVRRQVEDYLHHREIDSLVQQLVTADLSGLDPILDRLDKDLELSQTPLRQVVNNPSALEDERLRALVFLSRHEMASLNQLLDKLVDANADTIAVARKRLKGMESVLEKLVFERLISLQNSAAVLRLVALLPTIAADKVAQYRGQVDEVCDALLVEQGGQFDMFCQLLQKHKEHLLPKLMERFRDDASNESQRDAAARALTGFANNQQLCDLIVDASPAQHLILASSMAANTSTLPLLVQRIETMKSDSASSKQLANLLLALLRLAPEHALIDSCLSESRDQSSRTHIIVSCFEYGVPLEKVWQAYKRARHPLARQATILALEPYRVGVRHQNMQSRICGELASLVHDGARQAERAAAEWVLKRWNMPFDPPNRSNAQASTKASQPEGTRDWTVNSQGQVMVTLKMPLITSDPQALSDGPRPSTPNKGLGFHSFAISTTEITRGAFELYDSNFEFVVKAEQTPDCPANGVSALTAIRYCRWLSEKELDEAECCYPPINEISTEHLILSNEQLKKTGYRLATEAEWEWACGGDSVTPWMHGNDDQMLSHFAWLASNSRQRLHPVASLIPNTLGLFDTVGNVGEWCHPLPSAQQNYALRGGAYTLTPQKLETRSKNYPGSRGYSFTGFRIARTIANN